MFASTIARTTRLRNSRSFNPSSACHRRVYHDVAESSRMALSLQKATRSIATKSEPSFPISSPATNCRICFSSLATQQTLWQDDNYYHRRSLSTTASAPDTLPASATTGTIAAHKAPIPTERDIAMAGGVWAVTSAKRDKLNELKAALGEEHDTLDDMATEDELLDLHLADGLKLIAKVTDSGSDAAHSDAMKVVNDFSAWLDTQQGDASQPNEIDRTALGIKLEVISAKLDNLLETVPSDRCLRNVRDFLDPGDISEEVKNSDWKERPLPWSNNSDDDESNNNLKMGTSQFWDSVTRYRLLLAKSAIDHVLKSWKILTTVSDADIDRAAAEGVALQPELDSVSLDKIIAFLQTNVSGSCSDRIAAAWDLMDRDQDGSLDEDEMHQLVHLCLNIEVEALQTLFQETLDAFPVRVPISAIGSDEHISTAPKSWRQRRAEKKTKKQLFKMFQTACKKHFDVEVEINHRLRCIYAWANKADLDNQLKSVLVDEQAGWSGRKRYVELSPKISEAEFREVQEIHFKHINRLGSEVVTSFREDLWVLQGKRRERKDLVRNSFLFLAAVSAVDYVIVML